MTITHYSPQKPNVEITKGVMMKVKENSQLIYLMVNEFGRYKIGVSKNVNFRRKHLEYQSGNKITLVATWYPKYSSAAQVEAKLLNSLSKYRVEGEWFIFPETYSIEKLDQYLQRYYCVRTQDHIPVKVKYVLGRDLQETIKLSKEYKEPSKTQDSRSQEYWRKHYGIPSRK